MAASSIKRALICSAAAVSITRHTRNNPPKIVRHGFGRSMVWSAPRYDSCASHMVCAAVVEQKNCSTSLANQGSKDSFETWKIKMLYDGECPLCMREVNMLRERNKQYGTIKFVDISSDEYSPEENAGLDYKTVMGRIHVIQYDGTMFTDIAAFRRLYEEVGLGWVYAITKYSPIATIANAIYAIWAKYRLEITGRPPLQEVVEEREQKKVEACNEGGRCRMQ
uniref:Thiol-disulfide oxidoreductase DCC n=1 Tax=Araucaria cunninghamii TaxID=56994 RepID=A0A0D6QTA2_ARACU